MTVEHNHNMDASQENIEREEMPFDVVIVGGGPAGLSAAIRLKQLDSSLDICLIEKAGEIGAQIVSGAVIETRALDELLPGWEKLNAPLNTKVSEEKLLYLPNQKHAVKVPAISFLMPAMDNHGNYVISLGDFCRWLGEQAEHLGVEIFPGFSGAELYLKDGKVEGVITGDNGLDRDNKPKEGIYQPGVILKAKQVIFAEGARGSLTSEVKGHFFLSEGRDPQTYGLGIKEVWEVPADVHRPGYIQHSFGWPMDNNTYGGAFLYHFGKNLVSYGFVTALDYKNPWLSPFEEMQRTKLHPAFKPHFKGGKRIAYGARVISEGGLQSLPKISFPGGVLAGDSAGFLNMPKIKGTHTSMKSGMLAAEAVIEALVNHKDEADNYFDKVRQSWLWDELYEARNIRPAFTKWGMIGGALYSGIDSLIFRGHAPWTLHHHRPDCDTLSHASSAKKPAYPKADGEVTFDRQSSLFLSNIIYDEDQPVHLKLRDSQLWETVNLDQYDAPESRYCPADVYGVETRDNGEKFLKIHAQNCLQCKTCDIKDPAQNITWTVPEGGSGPNYSSGM